jgi:two-component system LytT family response regulator
MMRVAVIDDEPLARAGVLARLQGRPGIEVVGEFADGPSALQGLQSLLPDLVLIDIEMPGMSGLDVLAALPAETRPMAIFLTAYDQFALQAFALDVLDYLLKPIDDERFDEALERAHRSFPLRRAAPQTGQNSFLRTFVARTGSVQVFISADEVNWIEAEGDYCALHVGERTYLIRETVQKLSQSLDPGQFTRVHRSTIVRISEVAEMRTLSNQDALLRLRDGTPVRVSRTYIKKLLNILK